jgi:glucose 1-dehydrogenase
MVKQIRQKDREARAFYADVANPDAVDTMFKEMDDEWNGIDILINNAGIDGTHALAWTADIKAWRKVLEINLFGAFYCARQALKRMIPRGSGVILSITSVHEIIPWSGYSAYTTSKAGAGTMMNTLAQEAAPHGVRVLSIGPGAVKTPINELVWNNPANMKDLVDKIPLGRIGDVTEIARMVVVLVSGVASYVTGRTLFVDGGMTDYPEFAHGG